MTSNDGGNLPVLLSEVVPSFLPASAGDFDGWDSGDLAAWLHHAAKGVGRVDNDIEPYRAAVGLALWLLNDQLGDPEYGKALNALADASGVTPRTLRRWRASAVVRFQLEPPKPTGEGEDQDKEKNEPGFGHGVRRDDDAGSSDDEPAGGVPEPGEGQNADSAKDPEEPPAESEEPSGQDAVAPDTDDSQPPDEPDPLPPGLPEGDSPGASYTEVTIVPLDAVAGVWAERAERAVVTRRERRAARAARVCLTAWHEVVAVERGIKTDDDLTVEAALWQLMGDADFARRFREARGKDEPQPGVARLP